MLPFSITDLSSSTDLFLPASAIGTPLGTGLTVILTVSSALSPLRSVTISLSVTVIGTLVIGPLICTDSHVLQNNLAFSDVVSDHLNWRYSGCSSDTVAPIVILSLDITETSASILTVGIMFAGTVTDMLRSAITFQLESYALNSYSSTVPSASPWGSITVLVPLSANNRSPSAPLSRATS